jgi:hypothetical protein
MHAPAVGWGVGGWNLSGLCHICTEALQAHWDELIKSPVGDHSLKYHTNSLAIPLICLLLQICLNFRSTEPLALFSLALKSFHWHFTLQLKCDPFGSGIKHLNLYGLPLG